MTELTKRRLIWIAAVILLVTAGIMIADPVAGVLVCGYAGAKTLIYWKMGVI